MSKSARKTTGAGGRRPPGRLAAKLAASIVASLAVVMGIGAGSASAIVYVPEGSLTGTTVNYPFGITFDGTKLYVANFNGSGGGEGYIGGLDLSTSPPGNLAERGSGSFRGVAVDPNTQNVYGSVIGSPSLVYTFDSSGVQIGEPFEVNGLTLTIASDAGGNVFAGVIGSVEEYAPDGQFIQALECTGCPGGESFFYVTGITFDAAGNMFVADPVNGRIVKFESSPGEPTGFGEPTEFVTSASPGPQSLAYDPTTGNLLAGMGCGTGFKVVVFDPDGGEVGEFGNGPEYHCASAIGDNPIGVDPSTGMAYISNPEDPEPNEATLYAYKPLPEPEAGAGAATDITQTTATLQASVNPKGQNTVDCRFEYGPTNAYGKTAPCTPNPGSASTDTAVEAKLTGLTPVATEHFRVVITTAAGGASSTDASFVTLPNPPTVTTGAASGLTQAAATIAGTVNPGGVPLTSCTFEYGPTAAYGTGVPCSPSPGEGSGDVGVSATLSGLGAATVYHYRIAAGNAGGLVQGADGTFTTLANTCATQASLCPPPVVNPRRKRLVCKKGFKKRKVHGKRKCVKRKKRHKKHRSN